MSKQLISFELDWGRMGTLDGLFIAKKSDLKKIIGKDVYFGEAFGKHSDVEDTMTDDMFTIIDVPDHVVNVLEEKIGSTLSGYNPVEIYLEDNELE